MLPDRSSIKTILVWRGPGQPAVLTGSQTLWAFCRCVTANRQMPINARTPRQVHSREEDTPFGINFRAQMVRFAIRIEAFFFISSILSLAGDVRETMTTRFSVAGVTGRPATDHLVHQTKLRVKLLLSSSRYYHAS